MWIERFVLPFLFLSLPFASRPALAQQTEPLSAIGWLSQSVAATPGPVATPAKPASAKKPAEPPVAKGGALPVAVATTALDGPSPDAAGLIAPEVSGLPRQLWGAGLTDEIAARLARVTAADLPALRQLLLTMLLAEAAAPSDAAGLGRLLLARVDKLLAFGALEQAAALIDVSGQVTPDLFRRSFDIALLTGNEDSACTDMLGDATLAPTFPARIFCLARSGDWSAAALTLRTAEVLGHLSAADHDLLARFLDPEAGDETDVPLPPTTVTPLIWKMYEAIGEPLSTTGLPLAFAHADLADQAGWKAQIEAAERLTRAGTIAPNVLLGLYTEREASASGGVWGRVEDFAAFDAAITAGDVAGVVRSLPLAWSRMEEAELEVPFATLYATALSNLDLSASPDLEGLVFRISLLSAGYEGFARAHSPADATEAFLAGLAKGDLSGLPPPDSLTRAIAPAFLDPQPSATGKALLDQDRYGEAVLEAIEGIELGLQGDLRRVTEGLSLLRAARLEDFARRTGLQLILLERRG